MSQKMTMDRTPSGAKVTWTWLSAMRWVGACMLSAVVLWTAGCSSSTRVCEGDFVVNAQDTGFDTNELVGCTTIAGNLDVRNTELSSLRALEDLRNVEGHLVIAYNSSLTR